MKNGFDRSRFEELMVEISDAATEALRMIPPYGKERARSYWYAHICGALGGDFNEFLGWSMRSMSDELEAFGVDDDGDTDDKNQDEDEDEDDDEQIGQWPNLR